jgi:hypothetical protein
VGWWGFFYRKGFTAEAQRSQRILFFSFPLRGRKAKISCFTGLNANLGGNLQVLKMVFIAALLLRTFLLPSSQRQKKNPVTLRPPRLKRSGR